MPRSLLLVPAVLSVLVHPVVAQPHITTPKEFLGFNFGDDYQLANYTKMSAYFRKLATESDRLQIREIGKTAEGRTQLMVIVSSPANLKNLEHFRDISKRLALAEGLSGDDARALDLLKEALDGSRELELTGTERRFKTLLDEAGAENL